VLEEAEVGEEEVRECDGHIPKTFILISLGASITAPLISNESAERSKMQNPELFI